MYRNDDPSAVWEMERQRLGEYDSNDSEYVGECEHCGHIITNDESYCETNEELFCCRDCFEEYYGFRER